MIEQNEAYRKQADERESSHAAQMSQLLETVTALQNLVSSNQAAAEARIAQAEEGSRKSQAEAAQTAAATAKLAEDRHNAMMQRFDDMMHSAKKTESQQTMMSPKRQADPEKCVAALQILLSARFFHLLL